MMHALTRYFFTNLISNELHIFLKKIDEHGFLSYTKHYFSPKKIAVDDDAY